MKTFNNCSSSLSPSLSTTIINKSCYASSAAVSNESQKRRNLKLPKRCAIILIYRIGSTEVYASEIYDFLTFATIE